MKKHLIAAAVAAAVAVPAAAQVTVYGIIDKSFSSTDAEGVSATAGTSGKVDGVGNGVLSSERLGFRGDEDLGGGLKAHFVYELGIGSTGISGGTTDARTQIVGLSGAFGRLNIGRDKTVSQVFAETFTAGGANNHVGEGILYKGGGIENSASANGVSTKNHLSTLGLERQQGFKYISPSFQGLEAQLMVVQADTEATRTSSAVTGRVETDMTDFAIYYKGIKGLTIGVSRGEIDQASATNVSTDVSDEATQIGARYKIGAIELFAQRFDAEGETAAGVKDYTAETNQFGISFAVSGNVTVYGMMSDGEVGDGSTKTLDTDSYQVGALYSLSKRTTAYVLIGEQENETISSGVKTKNDGFAIGVRHSF